MPISSRSPILLVSFCISPDWQAGALVAYKGKKKSGIHFKLKCLTDVTAVWNKTDEISSRKVHVLYTGDIKFQQARFTVLRQMQISFPFFLLIWQLLKIWSMTRALLLVHSLPPAALDATDFSGICVSGYCCHKLKAISNSLTGNTSTSLIF